jgi:hypothetical protein
MKKVASLLGALGVFLVCGTAYAATDGYVCSTYYWPMSGPQLTYGNFGAFSFTVYTAPNCTGSVVGTYFQCSAGAASTSCVNSSGAGWFYTQSREETVTMFNLVATAAQNDKPIQVTPGTCNGGASGCLVSLTFK